MPQNALEIVEKSIKRHRMLSSGDRVVVGCSGGADSSCLLHLLTTGLPSYALKCTAVYVDHGLRQGTDAEAALVARLAESLGADFRLLRIDVNERVRQTGESIQDAARVLRYGALRQVAGDVGAHRIAVGHTRSDQAETVLMQLIRGAGPKGLSGIAPVHGAVIRPLLDLSRTQVEAYCRAHGLSYVQDPSNRERKYLRSRIRHDLMPLLKSMNGEIEDRLAQLAEILRAEDAWMAEPLDRAVEAYVTERQLAGAPVWALSIAGLARSHLALRRRLIRRVYGLARGNEKALSFRHVERILDAVFNGCSAVEAGPSPSVKPAAGTVEVGRFGGVRIVREYDQLLFFPVGNEPPSITIAERPLRVPGETELVETGETIRAQFAAAGDMAGMVEVAEMAGSGSKRAAFFDWEQVEPPLLVRSRLPGDAIELSGGGRKRVKDLLIDEKVPRRLREAVPIVADQKGVLWVAGVARAHRALVTDESRRILALSLDALVPHEPHH